MLAAKQSKVFSPAANQPLAGSVAADPNGKHYVIGFEVIITGGALAASFPISLKAGAVTKWLTYLPTGAPDGTSTGYIYFGEEGIECPVNTAVTIESLGPGAGKAWVGNIVWKTKA